VSPDIWGVLGIEPTHDVAIIRRAYAAVLKRTQPDDDPGGFAKLRQAYEQALMQARMAAVAAQRSQVAVPTPEVAVVTPEAVPAAHVVPASDVASAMKIAAFVADGTAPAVSPAELAPARASGVGPAPGAEGPAAAEPARLAAAADPVTELPPGAGAVAPAQTSAPPAIAPAQTSAPPAAAPALQPVPRTPPPELENLRLAFMALKQAAVASPPADPQNLQGLLESCLRAPALEILSVQLEFESVLVHFLVQTLPVTQCLLEPVIQRWKWRERLRSRWGPGITALLAHADNLSALEQLQRTSPSAHRALTRTPRPLLLWFGILFFNLHRTVRRALGQFRGGSPNIFDTQALQWWTKFLTQPHPRPGLIRFTLVLMLCGVFLGADAHRRDDPLGGALAGFLYTALAGCLLTGLWWGLVDWPRHRLRTLRRSAPLRLRLGWAPACMVACVVSALLPDAPFSTVVAVVASLPLLLWAIAMAPAFAEFQSSPLDRVWALSIVNLPVVLWWALFLRAPTVLPTAAMSVIFATTLIAFALGQPLLWADFLHGLKVEIRQVVRWGTLTLALSGLALAVLTTPDGLAGRLILMCLVVIVLAHRTPAGNLSRAQAKFKHYVCIGTAFVSAQNAIGEESGPLLRFGGALFMLGVILNTGMSFYNDWRATRAAVPTDAVAMNASPVKKVL